MDTDWMATRRETVTDQGEMRWRATLTLLQRFVVQQFSSDGRGDIMSENALELLRSAVQRGYIDEVKKGANSNNILKPNDLGDNLFHIASGSGRLEVLQHLFTIKGSEKAVNSTNNIGDTPLHKAAFRGYSEVIQLLLKNKAEPTKKNKFGQTPRDVSRDDEIRHLFPGGNQDSQLLLNLFIDENIEGPSDSKRLPMANRVQIFMITPLPSYFKTPSSLCPSVFSFRSSDPPRNMSGTASFGRHWAGSSDRRQVAWSSCPDRVRLEEFSGSFHFPAPGFILGPSRWKKTYGLSITIMKREHGTSMKTRRREEAHDERGGHAVDDEMNVRSMDGEDREDGIYRQTPIGGDRTSTMAVFQGGQQKRLRKTELSPTVRTGIREDRVTYRNRRKEYIEEVRQRHMVTVVPERGMERNDKRSSDTSTG
ncbi:oxysterol-binding protein-related protein [Planoprotostelium fungivorum]|uniref:Oxysterol-binding protein-related protein n=1 Tax=Planoprotostelium fungivorum TaxID=1890364 RepID=A0A2P6N842_9EUKA|nr:oxysterol-binding protein-related protein [Planoprotostelium fungivorum]